MESFNIVLWGGINNSNWYQSELSIPPHNTMLQLFVNVFVTLIVKKLYSSKNLFFLVPFSWNQDLKSHLYESY